MRCGISARFLFLCRSSSLPTNSLLASATAGMASLPTSFSRGRGGIAVAELFRPAMEGDAVRARSSVFAPALLGHRLGVFHASDSSSFFCFGPGAFRVTVSLEILFADCGEAISPDPP